MAIAEALLSGMLEKAAESFFESRKDARSSRVLVDYRESRGSLLSHIKLLRSWSEAITLLTLLRDKNLRESFVELGLDVGLTRHGRRNASRETVRIDDIFARAGNAVVLGTPGAGKTTSLQRIAQSAIAAWETGSGGVPLLVRLRDLRHKETLARHLLNLLGVVVQVPASMEEESRSVWERRAVIHYLDKISAVLLVDGLDETPYEVRRVVESDLREIALFQGDYRLFLTCRTAEYTVPLPNVQVYTILPLNEQQVREFARRWLGDDADAFVAAVRRNPYAGAEVVPLTLAHLCAIYERDGDLPPRPIDVYEQIVSLLVEEWDKQRNVVRTSRYSDFSWRKKERFLQAIAYHLAIAGRKGSFRDQDLELVYKKVAPEFNLPEDDATAVIREVESHTGLVHEVGRRQFDFVHLVIQEYLTAMYAHRRVNAVSHLMPGFPNEMALVIAHSATPIEHMELALEEALDRYASASSAFLMAFLARLAIERPTWKASKRLGWIVLAFLDLFGRYFREVDDEHQLRVPPESLRILEDQEVVEAMRLAVGDAEVLDERVAFRLIPKARGDLPEVLLHFLKNRGETGLSLIKSERALASLVQEAGRRGHGRPVL